MEQKILSELCRLEKLEGIRILYAVESGSRAWGFASTNSDYDVRFIYVHPVNWYVSIEDKKDTIEGMVDRDLDFSGWDIKKALKLFRVSNPPLMEWLESPLVYIENDDFAESLRQLKKEFFLGRAAMYHYLAMAKNNWKSYFSSDKVRVKKYFYVLRPVLACEWIRTKREMAPMEFEKLLELVKATSVRTEVLKLLEEKRKGVELGEGERMVEIDRFLQDKMDFLDNELGQIEEWGHGPKTEDLDEIFQGVILG